MVRRLLRRIHNKLLDCAHREIVLNIMAKKKSPTWTSVKPILSGKKNAELLKLIADLYALNEENKRFVTTRYSVGSNSIGSYKEIIYESLYPNICGNKPIKLATGKKAISDYFKATKDKNGQLELMVYYLETGNQFTLDYGDINESFYSSLESMLDKILSALRKQSSEINDQYLPRLRELVRSARGMGWGYYDHINCELENYEEERIT